MFNLTQKKLALSFLLLGKKDRAFVLKALPQEKINVLDKLLEDLAQRGIESSSLMCLKNGSDIGASNFINGSTSLNKQSKECVLISDYAIKNNHEMPKKLLGYIQALKN